MVPEHQVVQGKVAEDANDVQDLILSCNKDGMDRLRQGQHKAAVEQFKYAEAILMAAPTKENRALLAVTLNNLGCYYKKIGKHHGALSYFRRALKMEVELDTDGVTLAGTHLNLCSIYSKLGKHEKAVQHALYALELMSARISSIPGTATTDEYSVLVIAYHNLALEREFLEQWDQALSAFQSGNQIAKRMLGEKHPLATALSKNCSAVMKKIQHMKVLQSTRLLRTPSPIDNTHTLPAIDGKAGQPSDKEPLRPMERTSIREVDWVKNEELAWAKFANKTLRPQGPRSPTPVTLDDLDERAMANAEGEEMSTDEAYRPPPLAAKAIREAQAFAESRPDASDMGAFRFRGRTPTKLMQKTPLGQALHDHPEALMDILDDSHHLSAPNDFRPNRVMKGSTRASRVVRQTGVFNSQAHRDAVEAALKQRAATRNAPWRSAKAQAAAAECIQSAWRSWFTYCQDHSEWMTISWICATMIQSHWRSYHVRRQRMDRDATKIQRHCRGFLVRHVMKNHTAAVAIQRVVVGMLTRKKLRDLHEKAMLLQRIARGFLARRRFKVLKEWKTRIVTLFQTNVRVWLARRIVKRKIQERYQEDTLLKAATDLQRMYRGWTTRRFVDKKRQEFMATRRKFRAARMIQNMFRKKVARKQVEQLRIIKLKEMEKAATFLRKVWLGTQTRKRYRTLLMEYTSFEKQIVTMQRYMRGCVCRCRLWRAAVEEEERLWAVVEMQRCWRGYMGRVRWENAYEDMWRREMGAAVIQRFGRGWVARVKVRRQRQAIARAEFERARRRFRAAQKIQALVRGGQKRKRTRANRQRVIGAVTCIQRMERGRALRAVLWKQVREQRATVIVAFARGFLVRKRRFNMIAKVIFIQRAWRRWLQVPRCVRDQRLGHARLRKEKAIHLQRHFRRYLKGRTISLLARRQVLLTNFPEVSSHS